VGSWVPGWLDEQVTKRLSCMPPSVAVECPTGCCQKVHRNFTGLRIILQGIEARDGHPADIDNLWLTDGASPAVHYMMKALLRSEQARAEPCCAVPCRAVPCRAALCCAVAFCAAHDESRGSPLARVDSWASPPPPPACLPCLPACLPACQHTSP
jgi:hypothetical protein